MIKSYLFIKKNRFQKKLTLYKHAFNLMFDFTLLVYIILLLGYFITAVLLNGDLLYEINKTGIEIERFSIERFWLIITVLPMAFIIRSSRDTGILFSSTEYLLLNMPYKKQSIWFILACERWIRSFIIYTIIGTLMLMFTSVSFSFVVLYIFILLAINILMTIPQWNLFQGHFMTRLFVFILVFTINIVNMISNSYYIGISVMIILLLLQPILWRTVFQHVDWLKTKASGDFHIWNMIFLSHITKTRYKRDKQSSFLQRFHFWKKPFKGEKSVYHRMWYVFFEKNIKVILQFVGTFIVLQLVLLFINKSLFPVAIALIIFAYTTFLAVLFEEHFTMGLIRQLPWDLENYKKIFLRWSLIMGSLFIIAILIFIMQQPLKWTLPLIILYIGTFYFQFNMKINRSISRLKKERLYVEDHLMLNVFFLLIICFSQVFPALSLCSLYFVYIYIRKTIFI